MVDNKNAGELAGGGSDGESSEGEVLVDGKVESPSESEIVCGSGRRRPNGRGRGGRARRSSVSVAGGGSPARGPRSGASAAYFCLRFQDTTISGLSSQVSRFKSSNRGTVQ